MATIVQSPSMDSIVELEAILERARAGTEEILAPVPDEELAEHVSPLQSPLVWELAQIGHFEELWLLRNLYGNPPLDGVHQEVYGAIEQARGLSAKLPTLRPEAVRSYVADVRQRVVEALEHTDLDAQSPLLTRGFVFGLVLQHELEHQETMLQTLQLRTAIGYPVRDASPPDDPSSGPDEVIVPGGPFILGATDEPWAYDNELSPHEVELEPFYIDRTPVTNAAFADFVEHRGYRSPKHWSPEGWAWRERENVTAPLFWEGGKHGWERIRFGLREPVPPEEPVQHVSWYEADAFARWAGKRLPTEAEWERAAAWHERRGKNRFPWGRESAGYEANLGHRRFSPAPAGSYVGGESPVGCRQLTGDVWEWTSSHFLPYPGFLAYPYPEYSEIYFGEEYRVLRGGSWATDSLVARTSFRNFDSPGRRHLFAGFRCARGGE